MTFAASGRHLPQNIISTRKIDRVFVSPRREMAAPLAALDDALSGQGWLVTLVGEPGISKTRTAQELAVLPEQQGAQENRKG